MRAHRHLARAVFGFAMLLGLLAAPAPAAAIDPIPGTPLPAEPEAVALPFVTDAITFDLDGDGTRELVLVTGSQADPGLAALQAWYLDDVELGASAAEHGNAVPLRRSASGDELLTGVGRARIDKDGMIAVELDDPAKLVRANRDGREILLVATLGPDATFGDPCCLTIWEVVDIDRALELRLVADTQRYGAQLIAADMDADGTDELLVTEGPLVDSSEVLDVSLLRWNGAKYERTGFTIPGISSCCATITDAGETDGVPGAEVLLAGPLIGPEGAISAGLHRVSLRGGAPILERAAIGELFAARALSLDWGPAVVTSTEFSTLTLWSWPRDGEAERRVARTSGGVAAAVFGTGSETRIIVRTGDPPSSVNVLPGDLGGGAGPSTAFGSDTRPGAFAATVQGTGAALLMPFFGAIPGGLPGNREVYVFGGRLVRPASDPDLLAEVASLALLPGLKPVGTVGPGGGWMALLFESSEFTVLDVRAPAVALLSARSPVETRLVATSSLMEPEANGGHLTPGFAGVAPDPEHPSGLIVGNEAASAEITGPPGTYVWWVSRGDSGQTTIGADGVAQIRLLEAAGPNAPNGSGTTASIWLVTPVGHGYYGTWRIRVFREAPSLAFTADDVLVDFSPTVSGRTVSGATVTVNGQPVDVTENGSFEASVDAGLLPTDVRVVALDPVGNRSERVVSVVWPLDYRRLPFVPMAVLLTIAAAAVLFLRRPDTGPSRRSPDDGATFEEIGG
ncbi:MAG: hypothetical protein AABM41_00070 [Chloroflexota bacterium]